MTSEETVCCECGRVAPSTNTTETLVSKTGWRLARKPGTATFEWRCRECWAKRKASLAASAPTARPTKG